MHVILVRDCECEITGCDNVTNSEYKYNHCGHCMYLYASDFSTYGEDCRNDGSCGDGEHMIDDCGICRWVYSLEWNGCVGCDGIAHSGKEWNPCGLCIVNTTSNFQTLGQDCSGKCDGTMEYDDCGQCLPRNNVKWNSCNVGSTTTKATPIASDGASSLSSSMSVKIQMYAIIGGITAIFIILVIAVLVVYKLNRKQEQQTKQVNKILKQYAPVDDEDADEDADDQTKEGEKDHVHADNMVHDQAEGVVDNTGQNV